MDRRLQLHEVLKSISGVQDAYFQPKPNVTMTYPCIVYSWDDSFVDHADNKVYFLKKKYLVTVIDRNPESLIPDEVQKLPLTTFDRRYARDGLNHTAFNTFF